MPQPTREHSNQKPKIAHDGAAFNCAFLGGL